MRYNEYELCTIHVLGCTKSWSTPTGRKLGGDDESRRRARKYIDLVRAQRVGPVHVDESSNDGDWVQLWVAGWGVGTLKSTHLAIKRKIVANSHH